MIIPLIAPLEQDCVYGDKDFVALSYELPGCSSKYRRNLFALIVGMPVQKYVYRRRLTVAYYAIDDFDALTMSGKVGSVSRAKKKIIDEYGDPPTDLQQPLEPDALLEKWGYSSQGVSRYA